LALSGCDSNADSGSYDTISEMQAEIDTLRSLVSSQSVEIEMLFQMVDELEFEQYSQQNDNKSTDAEAEIEAATYITKLEGTWYMQDSNSLLGTSMVDDLPDRKAWHNNHWIS